MTRTILALAALTGLGACVDEGADAPMRIIGNVVPSTNCAVDSTSTTFQDDGVIESTSLFGYVFTPSVRNDLQLVTGESTGPKTIYITHAHVHLEFYDSSFEEVATDSSLLDFNVPIAGTIAPGGGTSAFSFEIVPAPLLAQINDRLGTSTDAIPRTVLDAQVQMVGTRGGGGGQVLSNVFRYPVQVCAGCVFNDVGPCMNLASGFTARNGGACNALQDGVLDCCDNFLVCPAAPPPGS